MSEDDVFSLNWNFICKRCRRLVNLRESDESIHGVQFPNNDFSEIHAYCTRCFSTSHYKNSELKRTSQEPKELIKQLRGEIAQLKADKEFLQSRFDDLFKAYSEEVNQNKENQKNQSTAQNQSSQFRAVG